MFQTVLHDSACCSRQGKVLLPACFAAVFSLTAVVGIQYGLAQANDGRPGGKPPAATNPAVYQHERAEHERQQAKYEVDLVEWQKQLKRVVAELWAAVFGIPREIAQAYEWAEYERQRAKYEVDLAEWQSDDQQQWADFERVLAEQRVVLQGTAWQKAWNAYQADLAKWKADRNRFANERAKYEQALAVFAQDGNAHSEAGRRYDEEVDRYTEDVLAFNRLPAEQQSREELLWHQRRGKNLDRRSAKLDAADSELDRRQAELDQWKARLEAQQQDLIQRQQELKPRDRDLQRRKPPWIEQLPKRLAEYNRKEKVILQRAYEQQRRRRALMARAARLGLA